MTAAEKLSAAGFDGVIVFDECGYDDALIGVTEDGRAVYDYRKMVEWLMANDGMTEEEAEEWIQYNTIGSLPNAGDRGPIIMYPLE